MTRYHCQSFSITLPGGEVVRCRGYFSGPITERDREAIASMAAALKAHAERIKAEKQRAVEH